MKNISYQTLLKITACILFIFKIQLTYASMSNEDIINKLFETHGKSNVANFISHKRDGSITIEKNYSFINARGKPNLTLITAKSIIRDLKILKMDTSTLEFELDIYLENTSKKKKEEDNRLNRVFDDKKEYVLNNKLKTLNVQIKKAQIDYRGANSRTEQKQILKDIKRLATAYRRAKKEKEALELNK